MSLGCDWNSDWNWDLKEMLISFFIQFILNHENKIDAYIYTLEDCYEKVIRVNRKSFRHD